MYRILLVSIVLSIGAARLSYPKPHGRVVNYSVKGAFRCFMNLNSTINITLWEDDDSFVDDVYFDRADLRLTTYFEEKGQVFHLKGEMRDQPWDSTVEPYLFIRTDCSKGGVMREFCVVLPEARRDHEVDLGMMYAPFFTELQKSIVPCEDLENIQLLRSRVV